MNKKSLALTSLTILLPVIFGLILWDKLPAEIATHFDINGTSDGYSGKAFTVFAIPFVLLGIHLMSVFVLNHESKKQNVNKKMREIVMWICPVVCIMAFSAIYQIALGHKFDFRILEAFEGLLFTIIGNYMPKLRQNRIIGIRIPRTLNSEENWNKTHRFAGKLWTICGLVIIINSVLHIFSPVFSVGLIFVSVIVPIVYSCIYKRG